MSIGRLFPLFVVPTAYTLLAREHHADREELGARAAEFPAKAPSSSLT